MADPPSLAGEPPPSSIDSYRPSEDRRLWTALAFAAAVGATFLVQLPVLGHYFFGDDFIPLAEVATQGTWDYVRNLILLEDATTNWRLLTGLYYLVVYDAFGVDPRPFLAGSLLFHVGTTALIFWFVRRALNAVWPAAFAATFFGLSAASVPTVGQVTAFNNVLAAFFVMLSMVTLYEALERRRLLWWGVPSVLSFAAAIAANESAAVLAPMFALLAYWRVAQVDAWWLEHRERLRLAAPTAAFGLIGGAALIGFAACGCNQASNSVIYGVGDHIFGNGLIFLGRLLFPYGFEVRPGEVELPHLVAGIAALVIMLGMLVRGPALARLAVVFLALALLPQLPLQWALAARYVYIATVPFSMLAALLLVEAVRAVRRIGPAAPALLVVIAVGVLALQGWQTLDQNRSFDGRADDWRVAAVGLKERFPHLAEGSQVYVLGGPLIKPIWQFTVLPAMGEVLWGGVVVAALPADWDTVCLPQDGEAYVVAYDGGTLTPLPVVTLDEAGNEVPDLHEARRAVAVECPQLILGE